MRGILGIVFRGFKVTEVKIAERLEGGGVPGPFGVSNETSSLKKHEKE